MKIRVEEATIEVIQGDITDMKVDAIVNPANNHLWMGGGVAKAIKRKGGVAIEQEAVKQGPVKIGSAVVTSGGALKARYVIHAAAMGQDLKPMEEKIREATRNSLLRAEEKGIETLSFPAIGTGAGGLSPHLCARAMCEETIDFLQHSKAIRQIFFVLLDGKMRDVFNEELGAMFSRRTE